MQLNVIGARQIKAARALLDWSQEDLAGMTRLSIATIRKLELGYISPRVTTTSVIRQAIENAGLEFMDNEGVRRRPDEIATYQGAHGWAEFFEDIAATVKKSGGDVVLIDTPEAGLLQGGSEERLKAFERILSASGSSVIRCLLTDMAEAPLSTPRFEFRFISKHYVDPLPFCVFGNKFAMAISGAVSGKGADVKMIVMRSTSAAEASRRQFYSMWDKATPVGAGIIDASSAREKGKRVG